MCLRTHIVPITQTFYIVTRTVVCIPHQYPSMAIHKLHKRCWTEDSSCLSKCL